MFPIILISKNQEAVEKYITEFIVRYGFSPFYVFHIHPVKIEVTIDQIRSLKKQLVTASKEKRLIIIHSFDAATLEAQNALLKTLEEKTESNQFILVGQNQERMLPTIRSRSKIVVLDKSGDQQIREATLDLLSNIEKNPDYRFLSDPILQSITREDAVVLLTETLLYCKQHLLNDQKNIPIILKKNLQTLQLLQHNNINPQLAVDTFLIFMKKQSN
jgi:DNA polymerase III delta prime subunit